MARQSLTNLISMYREISDNTDPKELAKATEQFLNCSFSSEIEQLAEELLKMDKSTQVLFSRIALLWVIKLKKCAKEEYFDLRNEYSVKVGEQAYNDIKNEGIHNIVAEDNGFENIFADYFSKTHRTLQQLFSRLIFLWITKYEKLEESMEIYKKLFQKICSKQEYKDFWKCPLY